jgi:hypothetical protein
MLYVILGILIMVATEISGQNYMGMSQARIINDLGDPDRRGENFIAYRDLAETGENVYYIDQTGNCTSFEIVRGVSYLRQYKRILKSEFKAAGDNKYEKKTKKIHYCAELVMMNDTFQIKVHHASDQTYTSGNTLVAGM